MEAMVGISLYSYLYLKLEKMLSFLLSLTFSHQQNWRRGRTGSAWKQGGWEGGAGGRDGPKIKKKSCF
jgi:hypothetical protein